MRVGYAASIRRLPSRPAPPAEPYEQFLGHCELMEDLGFDGIWLSEHHFAEDDWNPSPVVVLSALTQRVKTLRIATSVSLVAMHNPIRLAEDCATLDILSGGRFSFGFGAGGSPFEYKTFGLDPKESFGRAYEAVEIMRRCWTEEEFSHHGKYYNFNHVQMRPKPLQRAIPIYSAPLGPQSTAKSAERGYNLLSAIHNPRWLEYPKLWAEAGHDPAALDLVSGPIAVHVAESKEKAWDEVEEGMRWCMEFYARRPDPTMPMPPPLGEFRKSGTVFGLPIPIGTPDQVLEALSAYKDTPLDEIQLGFAYPGVPDEHTKRSMRTFAKECLPEIHSWGGKRSKAA